ncbi:polysaccharide deacetylase family protein [Pedobacter alpinus]
MKISGSRHLLPLYHTVSDIGLPHIKNLYTTKNTTEFRNDLDFFLKNYKSVAIDELINQLKENNVREPIFNLTFDDGLKEIVEIIAPILLEKGVNATFFINSGFINNTSLFFRFKTSLLINKIKDKINSDNVIKQLKELLDGLSGETLTKKLLNITYNNKNILDKAGEILEVDFEEFLKTEPFVDDDDIQWLIDKGFTIGAHSIDHPLFSDITLDEQIRQAESSICVLNEKFEVAKNRLFAFPFSDNLVSDSFFKRINNEFPTYTFGTSGLNYDFEKLNFQRVPIENSSFGISELIKMYHLKFLLRKFQL